VCRAQLGDSANTNPQQGQTPVGAFTVAVQTALWQAGPDTRTGGTTFDIEVTVTPIIGYTTANLWSNYEESRDWRNAGCNQYNCDCVSQTTTKQLTGGSYIFKLPLQCWDHLRLWSFDGGLGALAQRLQVSLDVDARLGKVRVEGMFELHGEPIRNPVSGQEHRARIDLPHGFEYELAEMGSASSSPRGNLTFELKNSYAQFARLHLNNKGLVRHRAAA